MVEELQGIFNLFDRDGNGTIDVDELEVLMEKLGTSRNGRSWSRQIIMEVDHNKVGELQFGEFCLFIKKIKEGGIHGGGYQEALATQIDELSGSADGYVGAEDIKMMMQVFAETTGQTISEEDIQISSCWATRPATRVSRRRRWRMRSCWTPTRHEQARPSVRPSREGGAVCQPRRRQAGVHRAGMPQSSRGRRCLRMSDNARVEGEWSIRTGRVSAGAVE